MATRKDIVKQAQAWLGLKEKDGSYKVILDTYNSHKPLARGHKMVLSDEWCAAFVTACAIKCNATDIIPKECSCNEMIKLLKALGAWEESDAYKPNANGGDLVFYDWKDKANYSGDNTGRAQHVGIVEKVSGNTITVIEGNKGEKVARRTLKVNGRYIRGFGVPKYDEITYKVGDKVKLASNATVYNSTKRFSSWVYLATLYVREVKGDRVVVSTKKTGAVTGAVNAKHLIKK